MIATKLAGVQVWVATTPVDMRKSFDGLAEVVRLFLKGDPLSGNLFVFRNRGGQRVKVLWWDTEGLVIYYKKPEADYPHLFLFTEIGEGADNLARRPGSAG